MDTREALKDYDLRLYDENGAEKIFKIEYEIGRGASCIAYRGYYLSTQGEPIPVTIKECYPFKLNVRRESDGSLNVGETEAEEFEEYKKNAASAFLNNTRFFQKDDHTNDVASPFNIYRTNNSIYSVVMYSSGNTIDKLTNLSLHDAIHITCNVADSIKKIHDSGCLYLDVKPSNIKVLTGKDNRVQLFDFDSLIPCLAYAQGSLSKFHISYSQGYSPIEQRSGDLRKIGAWSDVYSVGALLFGMLFGRPPFACECDHAKLTWSACKCVMSGYDDKLFFMLQDFFDNTLAIFYKDRYQNMDLALEMLEKLFDVSNPKREFLRSSNVVVNEKFVGRAAYLDKLHDWYVNSKDKCVIVSGMGGIGKSDLVRKFLTSIKDQLDHILFLRYVDTVVNMINDDEKVFINTIKKDKVESSEEYYERKIRKLSDLIDGTNSILVIDDFEGLVGNDITGIFDLAWRVIIIKRDKQEDNLYPNLHVKEFDEKEEYYQLFTNYSGLEVTNNNCKLVDELIMRSCGHTMLFMLYARQIKEKGTSLHKYIDDLKNSVMLGVEWDKVLYSKDEEVKRDTVKKIMTGLFHLADITDQKFAILKAMVIFLPEFAISLDDLYTILEKGKEDVCEDMIDLQEKGWIMTEKSGDGSLCIMLHPLIREVVSDAEWVGESRNTCNALSLLLLAGLSWEADKGSFTYPMRNFLHAYGEKAKKMSDKKFDKFFKTTRIGTLIFRIYALREPYDNPLGTKMLSYRIIFATSMIDYCERRHDFLDEQECLNFKQQLVHCLPKEFENQIIGYANDILSSTVRPSMFVRCASRLVEIYLERKDFESAERIIDKVRKHVGLFSGNLVKGLYHFILANYYDCKLDGDYRGASNLIDKLIREEELSGRYFLIRSVLPMSGEEYARHLLSIANILIRTGRGKAKKIKKILEKSYVVIQTKTSEDSEMWCLYHVVAARYYAMTLHNFDFFYEESKKILNYANLCKSLSLYDYCNEVVVPLADMYREFNKFEVSKKFIKGALDLCEGKKYLEPYRRMKMAIEAHLQDVVAEENYFFEHQE